ncbi:MAG: right-handed parallel beta-helix repeat-containing protein [Candidatus Bathyarchaeota archaeon]|nr:right-handed parallel beta-helix repeat-containing protein [Candidatus Bathyarchaeota archaeon]MDH5746184.1 right-handed parallel beta-helix repeat-containing protein [Candidatus Bathyarchaeota archaeon]
MIGMSRRLVLLIILVVFIGMLSVATKVQRVKAGEYIIIKVDGSVDPPTAPISSVDNITYVFTDNIYDTIIVVWRDNVVVDGAGYTLQGTGVRDSKGINIGPLGSDNVTIRNMKIENFFFGIYVSESSNNTISGNNITNNSIGIWLCEFSDYTSITGNSLTNNGITVILSSNNTISDNNITSSRVGIMLAWSSNNSIAENHLTNNDNAVLLHNSSNNSIYHNNFVSNTSQVYLGKSPRNVWDNGFEGNYWSNYTGVDSNNDGIGDSHHIIDANNTDNYPLMGMFSSFNTSLSYYVNVISNSVIEDFEYFKSNSTIKMYVSGEEGFGFCRVTIPHVLMNVSSISVIIDDGDTSVVYHNYTLYDNGSHRWIYFAYEHSIHKIDIIREFPLFLVLPLFMIPTLLAVIVYKRKHSI